MYERNPLFNMPAMNKYINENKNQNSLSLNSLIFIFLIVVILIVFYFLYKNKKDYQNLLMAQENYYLNKEKEIQNKKNNENIKFLNSEYQLIPNDLLLQALL